MSSCRFVKSGAREWLCESCGWITFPHPSNQPHFRCFAVHHESTGVELSGFVCEHLGQPSLFRSGPQAGQPVTIEVTCDTCGGGRTQQRQAVYKCEKLGRCLPHYRPSDAVMAEYQQRPDKIALCHGCPHFTPPA